MFKVWLERSRLSITQSAASFPYKSSSQCKDVRRRVAAAALPTPSSPEGGQTCWVAVLRIRKGAVEALMTSTVGKAIVKMNAIALKPGSPHSKDESNVQGAPSSA